MKLLRYIILALPAILVLSTCVNETLPPIFYTLANEYDIDDDRGIEDTATIVDFAEADGNYFAVAAKLIYRTPGGRWKPEGRRTELNTVPLPSGLGEDTVCTGIEVVGANLFAAFVEYQGGSDSVDGGIYYTGDASDPETISWTQVTDIDDDIEDTPINWIKAIGGRLFVAALKTDGSGDSMLYSSNNPTMSGNSYFSVTFTGGDPTGALPIVDVADNGGTFWVIVGPYLYSGALGSLALENGLVDPQASPGYSFRGVMAAGGALYLTGIARDQDGATSDDPSNLWMTDDSGSTWTRLEIYEVAGDTGSPLIELTEIYDSGTTSTDHLLGTVGFGYFLLDDGAIASATVTRPDPADIGGLDIAAINTLYELPSDTDTLFACTSGAGLWRGEWNGAKWIWKQE